MTAAGNAVHLHATALVLGEKGLLLRGPSGAGKSSLALALIAFFEAKGEFARLVGDDRVRVEAVHGRLVARPHPLIEGVLEVRGLGLSRLPCEPACILHALVDVRLPGQQLTRCPEEAEKYDDLCGIALPRLATPACGDGAVARIAFFLQSITTI